LNGGLVLVARAGFFNPNGNRSHGSHRDATLPYLRKAGTGGANVMAKSGHGALQRFAPYILQPACQAELFCARQDCVSVFSPQP
jgi:hypothetical protein